MLNTSGKLLTYKDNELYVSYDQDKNIKLHPINGVVVNYDGKSLGITGDDLTYDDGTNTYFVSDSKLSLKENSGDKELEITDTKSYLSYDANTSISYENDKLTTTYGNKVFELSSDMQISYSDPDNQLSIDPTGMSLDRGGKTVSLEPSSTVSDMNMEISLSSSDYLRITDGLLEYSEGSNEIKLGREALYYSDGTRSIDLSKDDLSLSEGDNTLTVGSTSFGVTIGSDKHLLVDKASLKVDFKYDDITASFSSGESLSFSDGQRAFSLGSTGLSVVDGDKSMSVLNENGSPALELISSNDRFFVNKNGFSVNYDNKTFAINSQEYLHIDFDSSTYIKADNTGATFNKDGNEFIIGGSTNFLELRNSSQSLAFTQDQKLTYSEGSYFASLSKDLKVELSDGTRTLKLFDDNHVLKYIQGNYEFGLRGGSGNKPGIDLSVDGNTIFVEGTRSTDVTVGLVSQEFGSVSVTCDKNKNIDGAFSYNGEDYFLQAGSQGLSFGDPNDESQNAQAEILDGATPTPEMNGPQYIGDKITDGTNGRVSGLVQVYYNSAQEHFIGNAAVASTMPPCVDAGLAIEVTPSYWKFDLGTENDMIQIYPTCSGFGGGGWLGLTPTEFNVGVFVAWRAEASVRIGGSGCGCRVWGLAEAELGVRASGEYKPEFLIKRAGVWVRVYVGLGVDYWCPVGGSLTIAEAEISGELDLYFEDKTRVEGKLAGYINILDLIKADFDMQFNTSF